MSDEMTLAAIEIDRLRAQLADAEALRDQHFRQALENGAALSEARAQLAERERELEGARKDTERYRWLRDIAPPGSGEIASVRGTHSPSEIDSAIDAAIAKEQP